MKSKIKSQTRGDRCLEVAMDITGEFKRILEPTSQLAVLQNDDCALVLFTLRKKKYYLVVNEGEPFRAELMQSFTIPQTGH